MKLPRDLSGRNLARALEVLGYSITRRLLLFFIRIGVGALTGAVVGLAIAVFVAGVYALPKAADLTARLGPLGEVATAGLAGATLTGLVAGCLGTLARGPASATCASPAIRVDGAVSSIRLNARLSSASR